MTAKIERIKKMKITSEKKDNYKIRNFKNENWNWPLNKKDNLKIKNLDPSKILLLWVVGGLEEF